MSKSLNVCAFVKEEFTNAKVDHIDGQVFLPNCSVGVPLCDVVLNAAVDSGDVMFVSGKLYVPSNVYDGNALVTYVVIPEKGDTPVLHDELYRMCDGFWLTSNVMTRNGISGAIDGVMQSLTSVRQRLGLGD